MEKLNLAILTYEEDRKDSQEHLRRTYGDVGMDIIYMLIFTCST